LATMAPLASTRYSWTLAGTTGWSGLVVIRLVTVSRVAWLTTMVDGWATRRAHRRRGRGDGGEHPLSPENPQDQEQTATEEQQGA